MGVQTPEVLTQTDSSGRLLLFKALIREENYTIANIYGPNKDAKAVQFYHKLSNLLRTNDFGNEENLIMERILIVFEY